MSSSTPSSTNNPINLTNLQTEHRNPHTTAIDTLPTLDLCQLINNEDSTVASSIQRALPTIAAAIDSLTPRIRAGGRLIYVGAGTSGRLGILDASEIPPTFSAPSAQFIGLIAGGDAAIRSAQEGAEDSPSGAIQDLTALSLNPELDTVLGIAASGRTPYVLSCLRFAKERGCLTLGVACVEPSEMGEAVLTPANGGEGMGSKKVVDHMISIVTGAEVVTGSTRLKAGTGTKMVLNMLSTGVMIRTGKTFGNMMIDLQSTNLKLKQRSRNIIRSLVAAPSVVQMTDAEIDHLIASCNGSVKLALLTLKTGLMKGECELLLEKAGGVLATALELWKVDNEEKENSTQNGKDKHHINGNTQNSKAAPVQPDSSGLAVCIDGGGTKCAVAVADGFGNVGKGEAGACNFYDIGLPGVLSVITSATQKALANLPPSSPYATLTFPLPQSSSNNQKTPFTSLLVGLAGIDLPSTEKTLKTALANLFHLPASSSTSISTTPSESSSLAPQPEPTIHLTNDVTLLAFSVLATQPKNTKCIVLISGTGSVAMSYAHSKPSSPLTSTTLPTRLARIGGWGHILGDEGSGFDIGRAATRALLADIDMAKIKFAASASGAAASSLAETPLSLTQFQKQIMARLDIPDVDDYTMASDMLSAVLRRGAYVNPGSHASLKSRIASVAGVVLAGAAEESGLAREIADRAVENLVERLVRPLYANMGSADGDDEVVLVLSGGCMKSAWFRGRVQERVSKMGMRFADMVWVEDTAVEGVAALGRT